MDVSRKQGCECCGLPIHTNRGLGGELARDVEEDFVLATNDVRDTITVISNRSEATTAAHLVGIVAIVERVRLLWIDVRKVV